jgi:hypothetical protein
MDIFLLLISVPLFLIVVLLFSLYVLPNYVDHEREPVAGSSHFGHSFTENNDGDHRAL